MLAGKDGSRRVDVHGGAILDSASDGTRIFTAGDDGKVVATDATKIRNRWQPIQSVDGSTMSRWGRCAVAWSAGKQAFVKAAGAEPVSLETPSSIGGLAFAPKGFRWRSRTTAR